MKYIRVKNLDRYQHYKDRRPSWVKLYVAVLDDYAFLSLPDREKWAFLGLIVLSANSGGFVENCQSFVKNRLGMSRKPNLKLLEEKGLIVFCDSKSLSQRQRQRQRQRREDPPPPQGGAIPPTSDQPKSSSRRPRRRGRHPDDPHGICEQHRRERELFESQRREA